MIKCCTCSCTVRCYYNFYSLFRLFKQQQAFTLKSSCLSGEGKIIFVQSRVKKIAFCLGELKTKPKWQEYLNNGRPPPPPTPRLIYPPGPTMPHGPARHSPSSCVRVQRMWKRRKNKSKKPQQQPLTSLACFSAFFAAFSASFCCFFRPFFDWTCWSSSAALQQEETQNVNIKVHFHTVSSASHEEIVECLGKKSETVSPQSFHVDSTLFSLLFSHDKTAVAFENHRDSDTGDLNTNAQAWQQPQQTLLFYLTECTRAETNLGGGRL